MRGLVVLVVGSDASALNRAIPVRWLREARFMMDLLLFSSAVLRAGVSRGGLASLRVKGLSSTVGVSDGLVEFGLSCPL